MFTIVYSKGSIGRGMSKKEVIAVIGQPKEKQINGAYEKWIYEYAGDLMDEIEFKNGIVNSIRRWAIDSKGNRRIVDIMY